MRAIGVVALVLLAGCARFSDALECDAEANRYRVQTVVQDQVCTGGRGIFGGIVTTCQAVPRLAYVDTPDAQAHMRSCMIGRDAERRLRESGRFAPNHPLPAQRP